MRCCALRAGGVAAAAEPGAGLPAGLGQPVRALACGSVDVEATRDLLAAVRPRGRPLVFAIDQTSWPRCDAETSPQRGVSSTPRGTRPASRSWPAGAPVGLPAGLGPRLVDRPGRRAADPAGRRPGRRDLAGRGAARRSAPRGAAAGVRRRLDPVALTVDLAELRAAVLVRIRSDRVFYADPPQRPPGTTGRPRERGQRFTCQTRRPRRPPCRAGHRRRPTGRWSCSIMRAASQAGPTWPVGRGSGSAGVAGPSPGAVAVTQAPAGQGAVAVVGRPPPDLDVVSRRRAGSTSAPLRFCKQALGGDAEVRHPEQADRWTRRLAASTQLHCPHAVADLRLPWNGGWSGPAHPHPCPAGLSPTSRHAAGGDQCPKPCGGSGRPRRCRGPARRYPRSRRTASSSFRQQRLNAT